MKKFKSPAELEKYRKQLVAQSNPDLPRIMVCIGTGCQAYRVNEVFQALESEIKYQELQKKVVLKGTGCPGFCERGPLLQFILSKFVT